MAHVGIFLAEGFEELEALTPADLLRRAGIETDLISVTGDRTVNGSHGIKIMSDLLFDMEKCRRLDMLILPGGMPGTVNLETADGLCRLLTEANSRNLPLAAICRAPTILGHLGILKGHTACCYPGFEEELDCADPRTDVTAVTDGNIITARGVGCAIDFSLEMISFFCGKDKARKTAGSIVYNTDRCGNGVC